jgi:hypothetical protein
LVELEKGSIYILETGVNIIIGNKEIIVLKIKKEVTGLAEPECIGEPFIGFPYFIQIISILHGRSA